MLPRGQQIDILAKTQTDFSTPATGNYTKTYAYSVGLAQKQPLENDPLLGLPRNNDRDTLGSVLGLPSHDGSVEVPLDLAHFGFWLMGAMGTPTDSGLTPDFTHVFNSGAATLPYRTIELKVPTTGAAGFIQHVGTVVNRMTFNVSRAANYQRVGLDLLGRNENKLGATAGGTPAAPWALDRVLNTLPVFKQDGVVVQIISLAATYDNKLRGLEFAGSDYVAGYDSDEEATFTGTIRLRFQTFAQYDQAAGNTPFAAQILWQKSATRLLQIDAPVMRLERVGVEVQGPGGIEQSFSFRAEQSSTAPMMTATLKNGVASYA